MCHSSQEEDIVTEESGAPERIHTPLGDWCPIKSAVFLHLSVLDAAASSVVCLQARVEVPSTVSIFSAGVVTSG